MECTLRTTSGFDWELFEAGACASCGLTLSAYQLELDLSVALGAVTVRKTG